MSMLTLLATSVALGATATSLPNVLGVAFTWLVGSMLTALVCWVVSMALERRSPRAPAKRALLFVAYLLLALGGAALALEGHDFTAARPVLAAPLPLLAYYFFYLFS